MSYVCDIQCWLRRMCEFLMTLDDCIRWLVDLLLDAACRLHYLMQGRAGL